MFQIGRRRQKQRFHVGKLAIDQRHTQLGFIIAILPKPLHDNRRTDLLAIVGDQSGCRSNLDIAAIPLFKRLTDDFNAGLFGKHRCFRRVHRHYDMHFIEKTRATFDDVQMSGGHWVVRPGANCNCHSLKRTAIA